MQNHCIVGNHLIAVIPLFKTLNFVTIKILSDFQVDIVTITLPEDHIKLNMLPAYSNDLKWRIIYLHYYGYSKEQISKLLYFSISFINKVLNLYKKWGTVTNPGDKYQSDTKLLIKVI